MLVDMLPIRTSWIFRSRWIALAWAAGVIWVALQVAGPTESGNEATPATDNAAVAQAAQALGLDK